MRDWDAERYHRLSDPQFEWGRRVLVRLAPRPGERILDLGCGTGRLTREIAALIGNGCVVGVDRSPAMLLQARAATAVPAPTGPHPVETAPPATHFVLADGARLPFADVFDAVFSTATFHWIRSHADLFASIYRALSPGGRLVAQCGGGPNLERLLERAAGLMTRPAFREHFQGWVDPWNFAGVTGTRAALEQAGFSRVEVWLEEAPTALPDAHGYSEFLHTVCVRHHVARLPEPEAKAFLSALTAEAALDDPPFTLDYWRLNILAVKPVGAERAA